MTRAGGQPAAARPADTVDVLELSQALVRAPSPNPPGDERAVAAVATEACAMLGLPAPRVVACDERRPNLVTTLDFGSGGRHLVLAGHIDTKPVGDATWTRDPFAAEVDGDRLYGLGAADMKGSVAAMLVAAARVAADAPQAGRLTLLLTADEEDGSRFGARHVCASTPLHADAVVIGEPGGLDDDFDALHLVSRGIARMRVLARGAQGHSSLAATRGRNAGLDAARAAVAVADHVHLTTPPDPHGLRGWEATTSTALAFRGGVGWGVLPGRMAVDTEVRLLPGMQREPLTSAFTAVLDEVAAAVGADLELEFDSAGTDWLPATSVDPGHPVAVAAAEACDVVLGSRPLAAVFPGTTDATWFAELQGLPVLPALGPGLLRRAHAADEWLSVTALRQATDLFAELARRFCAGPGAEAGSP